MTEKLSANELTLLANALDQQAKTTDWAASCCKGDGLPLDARDWQHVSDALRDLADAIRQMPENVGLVVEPRS